MLNIDRLLLWYTDKMSIFIILPLPPRRPKLLASLLRLYMKDISFLLWYFNN